MEPPAAGLCSVPPIGYGEQMSIRSFVVAFAALLASTGQAAAKDPGAGGAEQAASSVKPVAWTALAKVLPTKPPPGFEQVAPRGEDSSPVSSATIGFFKTQASAGGEAGGVPVTSEISITISDRVTAKPAGADLKPAGANGEKPILVDGRLEIGGLLMLCDQTNGEKPILVDGRPVGKEWLRREGDSYVEVGRTFLVAGRYLVEISAFGSDPALGDPRVLDGIVGQLKLDALPR